MNCFACKNIAMMKSEEFLSTLTSHNIKDKNGRTILHHGVIAGFFDICKRQIENGADVSLKDNFEKTAQHYANMYNHDKIRELLIEHIFKDL